MLYFPFSKVTLAALNAIAIKTSWIERVDKPTPREPDSICAALIGTAFLAWIGRVISSGVFLTADRAAGIAWSALWASFFSKQVWAIATVWFVPAFFGRLWIVSYVACGLVVKGARRLDIGLSWFNKRFDIGRKVTFTGQKGEVDLATLKPA